jgi:hypothetical protein
LVCGPLLVRAFFLRGTWCVIHCTPSFYATLGLWSTVLLLLARHLVCGPMRAFFLLDARLRVYCTPFFLCETWFVVYCTPSSCAALGLWSTARLSSCATLGTWFTVPFKPCALAAAHISFRSPSANNYKASISGESSMCHDHHYFVVAALSFICLVLTLPAHRFV